MAAQKKPTKKNNSTKSKAKNTKNNKPFAESGKKQGIVFGVFIFALFMAAVVFIDAAGPWGYARNFFFGLFGWSAFLVPFFLLLVSVVAAIGKDSRKYKYRVVEGVVLFTLLMAFIHIVSVDEKLLYGEQIKHSYMVFKSYNGQGPRFGTGVFGALFGGLPLLFTGGNKLAAGIITALIIFALFMIFSGTSILKLVRSLKTPVEVVGDYAEEKIESMKETYETVSQDVQELKAKNAEKHRAMRDQSTRKKR